MASGDESRCCIEGTPGEAQVAQELLPGNQSEGLPKIEETDERGRVIHHLEEYISVRGCAICKKCNSSDSGYVDGMTMLVCDQCGREYHVACLKESGMDDLDELPEGEWFCEDDCKSIDSILTQLVGNGTESLSDSNICEFLESRRQQGGVHSLEYSESCRPSYEWQILCGKAGSSGNIQTLAETVNLFTDCLDPIKDLKTGRSLIPQLVHRGLYCSKRSKDYDFEGVFCVVLKLNGKVVSAALLQVFGQEIAEVPLVATSLPHQGQDHKGNLHDDPKEVFHMVTNDLTRASRCCLKALDTGFCTALMITIERLLGVLEVKRLVLPTPKNAKSIWINKFGFSQMEEQQLSKICRALPLLTITGTSMLEKPVIQIGF